MNYKKLKDWNSGFHDWVIRRHPHDNRKQNGFMGGCLVGERGKGKSTYAYKVMAKVYFTLNGYYKKDDEISAYKEALSYMIYEPADFQKLTITNKVKHIITPIICLDDASMHFGNMLHQTNYKVYSSLMGQTATVRTAVTGFLITTPYRGHIAKFLRDYDDFKGEPFMDTGGSYIRNDDGGKELTKWNRKMRFYKFNWYPDEKKYCMQIPFQDKYSCYIPDVHYDPYIHRKLYFEVKHDMMIADTVSPENRIFFIELKNSLPSIEGYPNLKTLYIDEWEKEEYDLNLKKEKDLQKQKINEIAFKLRGEQIIDKLKKVKEKKEQLENY